MRAGAKWRLRRHRQPGMVQRATGRETTSMDASQPAACLLLEAADRECAAGADPRPAAGVPAAADGLFRVWSDGPRRCRPELLDQELPDLDARGACLAGHLVHPAVDHQNGVRRTRRHRAAVRLAAPRLRVHRRQPDRPFVRPAGRRRRRLDYGAAGRSDLHHRLSHQRDGRGAAGRRGRRHEHGGGAAPQSRRHAAPEAGDRPRSRHGAGARAAGAVVRDLLGCRSFRMACAASLL